MSETENLIQAIFRKRQQIVGEDCDPGDLMIIVQDDSKLVTVDIQRYGTENRHPHAGPDGVGGSIDEALRNTLENL